MRRWFADKPKGFGGGKVYDTSVEERLLEEIEQSRAAQVAKLNSPTASAPNSGKAKESCRRFVDVYAKKDIRFGKVEKPIICETKDRHTSDSTEYTDGDLGDGNESSEGFDIEDFDQSLPSDQDESVSGIAIPPHENVLFECDLAEDGHETIDIIGSDKEETIKIKNGSTALSVRKLPKLQGVTKKQKPKQARKKSSKLSGPGSAVRLKGKEKAFLTGVLSKYNAKTDELLP